MSNTIEVPHLAAEIDSFADEVRKGGLICANKHYGSDGDIRYWGVSTQAYPLMERFRETAVRQFEQACGRLPSATIIMVNHISADRSPGGSGGGWHVDSVARQYKGFLYITDCTDLSSGPFMYINVRPLILFRIYSAVKYLVTKSFRYSEREVARLLAAFRAKQVPMLLPGGSAFFLDTSQLHRGAAITKGERILATAYMYDAEVPPSIRLRVDANNG